MKKLRILVVEDVPTDVELELRELRRAGIDCETRTVDTEAEFIRMLNEFDPDVILSDFSLPAFDGMSALGIARQRRPDTPFIFVSGTMGEEWAIESLKRGATDYVLKTNPARLAPAIKRALDEAKERTARRKAEEEIARQGTFLRQVIDLNPNFIFAKDREGRFVLVNQALADAYGSTVDQLLGKTDADFNSNAEEVKRFRRIDLKVMDTLSGNSRHCVAWALISRSTTLAPAIRL